MTARILDVTPDEYHRLPGFSSTLAKELIGRCELHAHDMYERKMEDAARDSDGDDDAELTEQQLALRERGNVLHALVLGKGKRIAVQHVDAYRTKQAKADRDAARAAGLIPVKVAKMEMYPRIATAILARLADAGHHLVGTSELAIEWQERTPDGPVLCRGMLDHVIIRDDEGLAPSATIYDLKIAGDATPDRCERSAESLGYAIQACAYTRALSALYPRLAGRIEFRFLFVEPYRPYGLWDPYVGGQFAEIGERRWLRAVHAWGKGLATGNWPDYRTPDRVEIAPPIWALRKEGFTADEY